MAAEQGVRKRDGAEAVLDNLQTLRGARKEHRSRSRGDGTRRRFTESDPAEEKRRSRSRSRSGGRRHKEKTHHDDSDRDEKKRKRKKERDRSRSRRKESGRSGGAESETQPKLSASMAALLGAGDPSPKEAKPNLKISSSMAALLAGGTSGFSGPGEEPSSRSSASSAMKKPLTGQLFPALTGAAAERQSKPQIPALTGASAARTFTGRAPIHCRDFKFGVCRWGSDCNYLHDTGGLPPQEVLAKMNAINPLSSAAPAPRGGMEPCIQFKLGRCTFGKTCKRLHDYSRQNIQLPGMGSTLGSQVGRR